MELDQTIARVKQLIAQREEIEAELAVIFGVAVPTVTRKAPTCKKCGASGHTARGCPGTSPAQGAPELLPDDGLSEAEIDAENEKLRRELKTLRNG